MRLRRLHPDDLRDLADLVADRLAARGCAMPPPWVAAKVEPERSGRTSTADGGAYSSEKRAEALASIEASRRKRLQQSTGTSSTPNSRGAAAKAAR